MIWAIAFLIILAIELWLFWVAIHGYQKQKDNSSGVNVPESAFAAILATTIVASWLGLILAELGAFSLAALSILLAIVAVGLTLWLKWQRIPLGPLPGLRLDRYDVIALLLALLVGILYAHPAEYIIGGQDPGVYVNIGINIAKTGSILIYDETLANAAPEAQGLLLYHPLPIRGGEGIKFPGFYVRSLDDGVITPQFYHIFSIWIAILYAIGGIPLALLTTPLFGWLAVLALYLLGRRLIHPGAGLLAMALLAVNISQLWFARNPFADVVLQCFVTGGFWTLAVFVDWTNRDHPAATRMAVLSAACFGLSHLIKLDAFVVPPVALGFVAYCWLTGRMRPSHIYFLGTYLLLAGHAALHGYLFPLPYLLDTFAMFSKYLKIGLAGLAAAVPVLALIAWKRAQVARLLTHLSRYRVWMARTFVIVVLFASLYAYFVRPLRADLGAMDEKDLAKQGKVMEWLRPIAVEPQTRISNGKMVRTFVEEGIVRVGWYLTPLGVWLGIAGFLYWTATDLKLRSAPFLGGAFLGSALVFVRGAIVSCYFWAFKRYIPVVVPAFVLSISYLVWRLWPTDRVRWPQAILPITISAFLLISYLTGSLMFWEHVEWKNAIDDIATLADSLPENAILLFHPSAPGIRISVPMDYIYDRDSYVVTPSNANNALLRETIARWHTQGRPVYWITHLCKQTFKYYGPLTQIGETSILWSETPCLLDKLPDSIGDHSVNLCIYQIEGTEYTVPIDLNANFGDQIDLMGYELESTEVSPGGELHLTLYWRALLHPRTDYTVFTHLLDEEQTIWGQRDSQPANATRPTSTWVNGQLVTDVIAIPVQADTPSGSYALQVGLYSLATMERLPVLDGAGETIADRVILETIKVTEHTPSETTDSGED